MTVLKIAPGIDKHFFMGSNDFARDPSISSRACKVYIYLISHQEGWQVTVRTVAKATGMGKNTVAAALRDLEEAGFIDRRQIKDAGGQFAGTEYLIHRERQPRPQNGDTVEESESNRDPKSGPRSDQQEHGVNAGQSRYPKNGTPENGQPESGSHKKTNSLEKNNGIEDQEEPPIVPQGGQAKDPDRFAEFYGVYPRRVGKIAAERAWKKAVKDVDPQSIIDGAVRFSSWCEATGQEVRFIAHPSTWLNHGRWDDELEWPASPQRQAGSSLADWGAPSTQGLGDFGSDPFGNLRGGVIDHEEQS